ncbi:hypothetical protein ACLOJK_015804 [Asimina triloba]
MFLWASCDERRRLTAKLGELQWTSQPSLPSIDQIVMDAEKGTLTVVGDVDPMQIVCQVKKTGKFQELVSVGPAKSEDKKPDDEKKKNLPQSCKDCQLIPVTYVYEEGRLCTIL